MIGFEVITLDLLIAKFHAYGFIENSLTFFLLLFKATKAKCQE